MVHHFKRAFVDVTGRLSAKFGHFIAFCILLSVLGPLCAGMGGKKKKKMMYLTTKNAGTLNTPQNITVSFPMKVSLALLYSSS